MRLAAAMLVAGSLSAQAATGLTREQMAADLRQLAALAEQKWAYAEDRRVNAGVDLQRLAETTIARLPEVRDDAGFAGLVREFVASLQDGHAWVHWPGKEPQPFRRWPFTVADTADGILIDEVLPAWNDAPVELQRGDTLVAIDGVPIADVVAAIERRTFASTPGSRRRWALRAAVYGESDPRRYTVRRGGGDEIVVNAAAAKGRPAANSAAPVEFWQVADGVAGVRITAFAHHDAAAWAKAAPNERDALLAQEIAAIRAAFARAVGNKALVLDLRGNGGGTDLLGMQVAACLLPKGFSYYGLASRGWLGGWSRPNLHRPRVVGEPPSFGGQLLVLIDEDSFSVTDNLCRCLRDLHSDVTFVGAPTGGGSGAPRPCITLPHSGVVVTVCTLRVTGPKGELIEGRGTVPDVPVRRTRAGVLAGTDEVLLAALARVR